MKAQLQAARDIIDGKKLVIPIKAAHLTNSSRTEMSGDYSHLLNESLKNAGEMLDDEDFEYEYQEYYEYYDEIDEKDL